MIHQKITEQSHKKRFCMITDISGTAYTHFTRTSIIFYTNNKIEKILKNYIMLKIEIKLVLSQKIQMTF